MPIYEWKCHDCNMSWDRECRLGKAPDRTRCGVCNKLCGRNWEDSNITTSFGNDLDFHTVRSRYNKHIDKGFDKTAANKFLHGEIKKSKESMDDESYRYKPANIDYEKLSEDGLANKLSDKETSEKVDRAKKLTVDAYDKANKMGFKDIGKENLDITKPLKQQ